MVETMVHILLKKRRIYMSKESVKLFFKTLQTDEKLQVQLGDLLNKNNELQVEKVIEVAAKTGYEFSREDVEKLVKEKLTTMVESGELSEEEMEAVAGGSHIYLPPDYTIRLLNQPVIEDSTTVPIMGNIKE